MKHLTRCLLLIFALQAKAQVNVQICVQNWCNSEGSTLFEGSISKSGQQLASFNGAQADPNGCLNVNVNAQPGDTLAVEVVSTDNDYLNGVSVLDLILLSQHILGLSPLNSPYNLIAADVNKSGSITTFDLVEDRKLITGVYLAFPNNSAWRIIPADYVFPDPTNPFASMFGTDITTIVDANFEAFKSFKLLKVGDVNCSAVPNLQVPAEDRNIIPIQIRDRILSAGETYVMPIRLGQDCSLYGFQFGLKLNPELLEIVDFTPGDLPGWSANNVGIFPDACNIVWSQAESFTFEQGTPIAYLKVQAQAKCKLSQALSVGRPRFSPIAYTQNLVKNDLLLQMLPVVPGQLNGEVLLRPNPTSTDAFVEFEVEQSQSDVTLHILNLQGKIVWQNTENLPTGIYSWQIPASALTGKGVYWYKLTMGNKVFQGKVVKE